MSSQNRHANRGGVPRRPPALRAPYRYNRPVKDVEFVQRVRQHAPSSLLPLVARYGAEFADRATYQNSRTSVYAPWVLAEVARVSLIRGTEFRSKPAIDSDLLSCCAAYQALSDPELGVKKELETVGHFLLRMGGQQLTFPHSHAHNLARTVALLEQTQPVRAPKIATPGWPERLLGCSLREYVRIAILLYTSALKNQGAFDLEWLAQPQCEEITRVIPEDTLRRVIGDNYAADTDQLKALQSKAEQRTGVPDAQYRRFGFNPLSGKPAVAGITDGLLMPLPAYILHKASPLGIYYAGMDRWGGTFTTDLGYLFEAYVGRQLQLLPDATVLPEIAYGRKKGEDSIDWFVIFEDCVVLVEVKSARPTEPVRLADSGLEDALDLRLGEAVRELNKSAALVRDGVAGFEDIPIDRPMIGLVVTMEPFHTVDAPFNRPYLPQCDIPFRICSASELEHLVTVSDTSVGRILLDHFQDPSKEGWSVESALTGHAVVPNRVGCKSSSWATCSSCRQ
jgi:hypothetical protein